MSVAASSGAGSKPGKPRISSSNTRRTAAFYQPLDLGLLLDRDSKLLASDCDLDFDHGRHPLRGCVSDGVIVRFVDGPCVYIIGACPSRGTPESYGNVMVGGNTLSRGCLQCKHWDGIPLPELQKKVIYLDQWFFSQSKSSRHSD